jgi:type VI secretion system secreted protein VgrG
MTPGHKFSLVEHVRDDFNAEYVVVDVVHQGYEPEALGQERPDSDERSSYTNDFRCIPSDVNFRPPRVTPRPYIRGTQSATVTGPAGEEIYCDEYGRIKVQFHWDRVGENDDKSSCHVRVSQQWAGPGYGFQTIPRIGNEVVVAFFEGNPDRPHIIGRVYNAENMPPYGLPDKKNQTGIRSESTKGGGGYNEIMMDDTKGSELFNVQAEKDMATLVKNDQSHSVGNDRTRDVGNDETVTVGANREVSVGANHTESVGGDEEITVSGSRTRSVSSTETISIGESQSIDVGSGRSLTVAEDLTESVGASYTSEVSNDLTVTVGGSATTSVTKESVLQADKIQLVAQSELTIKVGGAKLVMKSNGDITLDGKKINVKGSGDVILKGSKVKAN